MGLKDKIFIFQSDPGHAWLSVKRKFLDELGIADKITRFSYQRGATVYLEEDCDVTTFFEAFKLKFGEYPKTRSGKSTDNQSHVRNYETYKLTTT